MTALTLDSLAIVQILRKRGFSEEQATGVVEAFREIDAGSLATKADLREVELKLESKIETSSANLKVDILRWLVVTQMALGGFLLAALKFLR
ncbi:hypothetical protein MSC49_02800 [Methylosinus sp. C49]|uniref:hypothetical protein n=1 Tax=Methylosinus sp. C49 TaxID=2699395 RepID=UPI0013669770|nr:hypothetical protein [Methylosinus sp. C49]BBU60345.1 hypothetical protein MSC49_02800 [Methylosinus sp. C49]